MTPLTASGLPGFGSKSAGALLLHYGHLENIPAEASQWDVPLRGADKLAATLVAQRDYAFLFRDLATLRSDEPLLGSVEELRWDGPTPGFEAWCDAVEMPSLWERAVELARRRA